MKYSSWKLAWTSMSANCEWCQWSEIKFVSRVSKISRTIQNFSIHCQTLTALLLANGFEETPFGAESTANPFIHLFFNFRTCNFNGNCIFVLASKIFARFCTVERMMDILFKYTTLKIALIPYLNHFLPIFANSFWCSPREGKIQDKQKNKQNTFQKVKTHK